MCQFGDDAVGHEHHSDLTLPTAPNFKQKIKRGSLENLELDLLACFSGLVRWCKRRLIGRGVN